MSEFWLLYALFMLKKFVHFQAWEEKNRKLADQREDGLLTNRLWTRDSQATCYRRYDAIAEHLQSLLREHVSLFRVEWSSLKFERLLGSRKGLREWDN